MNTKINTSLLFISFILLANCIGQNYSQYTYNWALHATEEVTCINSFGNDTTIMAGYRLVPDYQNPHEINKAFYLQFADGSGNLIESHTYWNDWLTNYYRLPKAIEKGADGNLFIVGMHKGDQESFPWIMKTNKRGRKLWENNLGIADLPQKDGAFNAVVPSSDGGCVALGYFVDNSNGSPGIKRTFIMQFDHLGQVQQMKVLSLSDGIDLTLLDDGSYCIFAQNDQGEIGVAKVDSGFNPVWYRTYYSNHSGRFSAVKMKKGIDENVLITGIMTFGLDTKQVYLLSLNTYYGSINWQNIFAWDGMPEDSINVSGMDVDDEGNIYISGNVSTSINTLLLDPVFETNAFILKANKHGLGLWAKEYGQDHFEELSNDLHVAANGDLILGGSRKSNGSSINSSFIHKITPSGNTDCFSIAHIIISYNYKFYSNNHQLTTSEREFYLPTFQSKHGWKAIDAFQRFNSCGGNG
ncbi:MAG: hypothetical protein AAFO07_11995 [Bacteroidota bacterium]